RKKNRPPAIDDRQTAVDVSEAGTSEPTAPEAAAEAAPKKGMRAKLTRAISKTRMVLNRRVLGIVGLGQKIDEDILEKLEDAMIEADFGVDTTEFLMEILRDAWKGGNVETTTDIIPFLRKDLKQRLTHRGNGVNFAATPPTVILVVGVN